MNLTACIPRPGGEIAFLAKEARGRQEMKAILFPTCAWDFSIFGARRKKKVELRVWMCRRRSFLGISRAEFNNDDVVDVGGMLWCSGLRIHVDEKFINIRFRGRGMSCTFNIVNLFYLRCFSSVISKPNYKVPTNMLYVIFAQQPHSTPHISLSSNYLRMRGAH